LYSGTGVGAEVSQARRKSGLQVGVGASVSAREPTSGAWRAAGSGTWCYRDSAVRSSAKGDVFADEPWLSIQGDRESRCIYAEWRGFANSGEFRASLTRILEAIRAIGAVSLVSDNRRLEGVTDQDQLWIRDTWTPLAVGSGLTRIAAVVPQRGLGKIATEQILGQVGMTAFLTHTFTTVSEAMEWVAGG
jgi:hypothetical protein